MAETTKKHFLASCQVHVCPDAKYKKLIRRWDSERELSLRRHCARTTKYNRLVRKFRHSFSDVDVVTLLCCHWLFEFSESARTPRPHAPTRRPKHHSVKLQAWIARHQSVTTPQIHRYADISQLAPGQLCWNVAGWCKIMRLDWRVGWVQMAVYR